MSFQAESLISVFDVGLAAAFGLLHLLLFLFYPKQKANLFFSLFAFGVAMRAFSSDTFDRSRLVGTTAEVLSIVSALSIGLAIFAFARYIYAAFEERRPIYFWIVVAVWLIAVVAQTFYAPLTDYPLASLILIGFGFVESLRVIIRALIRRREDAWIVAAGILLLQVAPLKDMLRILGFINWNYFWNTALNQVSICGILVANSVYLARRFAKTNLDLEAQLKQVTELSARELEHERTAAELRLQNEQERARIALVEQELDLAANIQQALFPETIPEIAGYDIAAFNRPARICGGDYYDVLRLEKNGSISYLFCVADVSGKGLPASLLMSSMQANLRALAGYASSLAELATRIGELLFAASPSNKFITAVLLEIEPVTGTARYVNAGHNECILLKGDGSGQELLRSTGLPLGMLGGMSYEERSLQISPGDVLALFSDGVPEAHDDAETEWGEQRLNECLANAGSDSAQAIVNQIINEIDRFADATPQFDDITLLVIKSLIK